MSNDVAGAASPIEQYITEVVEPQRDELQVWQDTSKHQEILLQDAQVHRKTVALKLGPNYLFRREGVEIGGVDSRVTTLVSGQAYQASQTPALSHAYLRASGLPTVGRRSFHTSLLDLAQEYRTQLGPRTVVRPASAMARPVTTLAASSADGFAAQWHRAADALTHLKSANQLIAVENFSTDLALRIFVVGERVIAAVARVPFYIVGDGDSTSLQLVENERVRRADCHYLNRRFLTITKDHFASLGVRPDQTLSEGEVRILPSAPGGAPGGGVSVDVVEDLGDELRSLAIDAMWAFPGLSATAIDIRTPSLLSREGALVEDVVPAADISEFVYPAHGERRRCGVAMIDHMVRSL